jgi:hypothetical protein
LPLNDAVLVIYLRDFIPSNWERGQLLLIVRAKIVVANPGELFQDFERSAKTSFRLVP